MGMEEDIARGKRESELEGGWEKLRDELISTLGRDNLELCLEAACKKACYQKNLLERSLYGEKT